MVLVDRPIARVVVQYASRLPAKSVPNARSLSILRCGSLHLKRSGGASKKKIRRKLCVTHFPFSNRRGAKINPEMRICFCQKSFSKRTGRQWS